MKSKIRNLVSGHLKRNTLSSTLILKSSLLLTYSTPRESGIIYNWYLNDTTLVSNTNDISVLIEDTGTQKLSLVRVNQCQVSDTIFATIKAFEEFQLDVFDMQQLDENVCINNEVIISGPVQDGVNYSWQVNDSTMQFIESEFIFLAEVAGTNSVEISRSTVCGMKDTTIMKFNVHDPSDFKKITFEVDSGTQCIGSEFSYQIQEEAGIRHTWYSNNEILGEGNIELTFHESGDYEIKLIREHVCGLYDTLIQNINVKNKQAPPIPEITLLNDTLFSNAMNNIQWYFENSSIAGEDNSYHVPKSDGIYLVSDSSECGISWSDEFIYEIITVVIDEGNSSVSFYPNPAQRFINHNLKKEDETVLEIYDINGNHYEKNSDWLLTGTIDISHLLSGVYLIKIKTPEGYFYSRIVVKN